MAVESNGGKTAAQPSSRKKVKRAIAIAFLALLAAVGIAMGVAFGNGDLAPVDAAAKYSGFNYIFEDEVSDYISLYREQMGLAESNDEDWATFLAAYNLTPARLRYSTIQQILTDKLVQSKADELGLDASEEEVDATVGTLRDSLGLGDDEILRQTLEAHGQTEEGLREVYRKAIVKRLVLSAEVETPTPSDDQVREYLVEYVPTLETALVRHTYCFRLSGRENDANREKVTLVNRLRDEFTRSGKTVDAFAQMVAQYSDDEDLVANNGANGWDADTTGYSASYVEALSDLGEGDVSSVFVEDDSYVFIWVDDAYTLPVNEKAARALDPSEVPPSLWSYLRDLTAYKLWEEAGDEYLAKLVEDADVVYYPMPSNVPYNVDMSLANVQLEEIEQADSDGQ